MPAVRFRPFALSILAAAWLAVAGCKPAAAPRGAAPIPVETALAIVTDVPVTISAVGAVEPLRTVEVKARVEGVIASVHFAEGQSVSAGDLLVTLDRRPFALALDRAHAELASARAAAAQAAADAARYRQLDAQNAVSKERLGQLLTAVDATAAAVAAREADAAEAELQLGYTEVRAPLSGRAGRRLLHEGAVVRAHDSTLVVLHQLDPVAVTFSVPENTLAAVQAALAAGPVPVRVHPSGTPSFDIAPSETNALAPVATPALRPDVATPVSVLGRLDFIDNAVNPATGTIRLRAVFPNSTGALWPGQFVDVSAQVGLDRAAVVVPAAAVQNGQRGPQVFVVQPDHTVALRPVRFGREHEGHVSLLEGVAGGDTVVINGQLRLVPGAKVEARTVEQAIAGRKPATPAKS